jgi:L-xylulokinase
MCKDYIRYKLTGNLHAELTDMSGTSLLNQQIRMYDADLLKIFGIEEVIDKLPPLVTTSEICGVVTKEASEITGLAEGTPVAGGMFDIDAAGLASGMVDETSLCMIAGTWGNNQYISKNPVISEKVFMTTCYSIPGYYLMLEGSATSASNLEWFVNEFFREEKERFKEKGSYIFEFCNELVADTKPEDSNIIFLPFLYGSNVHPNAKSCFIGIDGWNSRGQVLRAIYEGIVFSHKTHVEKLLQFREMPKVIQLTGGAKNSREWLQIFADVFQVPIEIPGGTELGTLGAAIAAGVASEVYGSYEEAVKKMVKVASVIEPDSNYSDLYKEKYSRYNNATRHLNEFWN